LYEVLEFHALRQVYLILLILNSAMIYSVLT